MGRLSNVKWVICIFAWFGLLWALAACGNSVREDARPTKPAAVSATSAQRAAQGAIPTASQPSAMRSSSHASAEPVLTPPLAGAVDVGENPPLPAQSPISSATQPPASAASQLPSPAKPTPVASADSAAGVTVTITGDDKHGVILPATLVRVKGKVSAIALLQQVTREHKIQMESSGSGIFAYVQGIDNLYEFDRGAKSGWLFKVNGVFSGKGAGDYKVEAGDKVEWCYTLDGGKDVGDSS